MSYAEGPEHVSGVSSTREKLSWDRRLNLLLEIPTSRAFLVIRGWYAAKLRISTVWSREAG